MRERISRHSPGSFVIVDVVDPGEDRPDDAPGNVEEWAIDFLTGREPGADS